MGYIGDWGGDSPGCIAAVIMGLEQREECLNAFLPAVAHEEEAYLKKKMLIDIFGGKGLYKKWCYAIIWKMIEAKKIKRIYQACPSYKT